MKQFFKIIIVSLFISLLTSCSTRPYFAIENKSDNEIKIELVFDTLNLKETVAQFIQARKRQHNFSNDCTNNPECDSIKNILTESIITNYIYDSLQIKSFFYFTQLPRDIEDLQINPINLSEKEFDNGSLNVNFAQTMLDYYHYDSSLVKKIINKNTLTLFLPTNYMFSKQCRASGDASCSVDEAFPNVKELRVIISKDNIVTLTKQNFRLVTKNKKIQSQSDSYSLEIE